MWTKFKIFCVATAVIASPAAALNEGLQCVPYARALSGVQIRGDAHSWWNQAAGLYQRGTRPSVGAVMSFRPHGGMRLGHVAVVRKIIDRRTLLISHANWSTINGIRGHIENDVRVIDASEDNDWSQVQVWYSPNNALGTTAWPLNGFIYPAKPQGWGETQNAVKALLGYSPKTTATVASVPARPSASSIPPVATFKLPSALIAEVNRQAAKEKAKRRS
jgi:surface antigen